MSSVPPSDIAYRVLRLEQQLDSYRQLHADELEQIRRALANLKEQVLVLAALKKHRPRQYSESNRKKR